MLKLYCAQILSAAIILAPVWLALWLCRRCTGRQALCYYGFTVYLGWVYALVGIFNLHDLAYIQFRPRVNLIPFVGMLDSIPATVLNGMMLLPLGFLLPVFWQRFRSLRSTLLLTFGTSFAIELLQMVSGRATDIDDLITNVLGALIGFRMAKCLWHREPLAEGGKDIKLTYCVTVLAMFLLHPYVLDSVWGLV